MERKRLKHIIRLWLTPGSVKRTKYLKSKGVFQQIGEDCSIMDRKVPLYSNLIRIGNNVHIASKVDFITHDIIHVMLNLNPLTKSFAIKKFGGGYCENIGCIYIENNVFIGSHTVILGNVKIGSNVIIAAGSLVNKDVQNNTVVGGVPAKTICTFEQFVNRRLERQFYPNKMSVKNQTIPKNLEQYLWEDFHRQRSMQFDTKQGERASR